MTTVLETVVSKSHFKAKALQEFRWVQETGRPVVITERGRPVLQVQPYRGAAEEARAPAGEPPRDPADRMILATARILGAVLVTQDARLLAHPHVRTLW
ncbi:MAG: PIN domain-containing protein [bacterium]